PFTEAQQRKVYGPDFATTGDQSYEALLEQASENWHVFHIIPTRGANRYSDQLVTQWREVLGERAIVLEDIDKLAEVIVATMQVVGGADAHTVAQSFDPGTAVVVAKAVGGLTAKGA